MPVYFGYERVLESSTYMAELSGKDKQSESVFDIFGIFRSLKRQFGQVTVNFGEPLPLQEFMDEQLPEWQQLTEIPSSSIIHDLPAPGREPCNTHQRIGCSESNKPCCCGFVINCQTKHRGTVPVASN